MKPLKLVMQAFGSYLGRTELDFTRLGEHPIFLITGQTGGGKTTILDAMCFALYCKATGGRRRWSSMRSTSAPQDAETLVEFTFALGAEQYRFFRSQAVYAARGTGVLKTKESHECYRSNNGEWELLQSGAESRVRECAEELLGLTCEQFSQVMILPQGDFLKLLLSNSRDKAQMFQTLFATQKWERVARILKEQANALEKQAGSIMAERSAVFAREEVQTPEELAEKLTRLKTEVTEKQKERVKTEKEFTVVSAQYTEAKTLTEQFQTVEKLKQTQQALVKEKPAIEEKKHLLERARKAAAVLPYYHTMQEAEQMLTRRNQEKEQAAKQLQDAQQACTTAAKQLVKAQECRKKAETLSGEYGALFAQKERVGQYSLLLEKDKQTANALQKEKQVEQEALKRMETAAKQVTAGDEYVHTAKQEAERLPQLLEEVQAIIQTNAAAALAQNLQEETPCPVCGSLHHPQLAVMSQQLEQAQSAVEQAKKSAQMLQSAEKRLEQRRAELEQAQKELYTCREQIARLQSEAVSLKDSLQQLSTQLGGMADAEKLEQRLALIKQEQNHNTQEAERIEQAAAAAKTNLARAATFLEGAQRAFAEAKEALVKAQQNWEQILVKEKLSAQEDYTAWVLPAAQRQELERRLSEYAAQVESTVQRLAELQALLEGKTVPNLEEIQARYQAVQEQVSRLAEQTGALEQRVKSTEHSAIQMEQLEKTGKEAQERFESTSRLAILLSGKNSAKVPLQQFVLGIMLDDILASANQFFAQFSAGRYSLNRIVGSVGGNALGGLDMEVFDAHDGCSRAVETLSGGELFLASLSLAFGLSDVVQSYSGSVHLDSIFIDEGFGSLDQETLDTAMRALAHLQKMGRTIGMISHVSELKSRIAAQIVVSKGTDGGSTAQVIAG